MLKHGNGVDDPQEDSSAGCLAGDFTDAIHSLQYECTRCTATGGDIKLSLQGLDLDIASIQNLAHATCVSVQLRDLITLPQHLKAGSQSNLLHQGYQVQLN